MPQIAQQDYKIIAPKPGRSFNVDAAALGELKKAILNGIGFDCLPKGLTESNTLNRVLGFFEDGSNTDVWDVGNGEVSSIDLPYTVTQYQGLAAVQNAVDEYDGGVVNVLPNLSSSSSSKLVEGESGYFICIDGKYLTSTASGGKLTALAISEDGPSEGEDFINISWEDAQKLIGLPVSA